MRVLEVIPTLGIGGAERMMSSLARHLHGWGHDVGVVSLYDSLGTHVEEELRSSGVELFFLGKRHGIDLRMITAITRTIGTFRPEVLHTHHGVLKYALFAALASRRCRIVHTMHSVARLEAEWPARVLQFFAFRTCVVPVAIGHGVAETMRRTYRLRPRHVIANGVRTSDFIALPSARSALRATLGIPAGSPTFVTVATLRVEKNLGATIRALASNRLRSIGAHLLLAGDGAQRGTLEREAHDLGVERAVHFLGVRSDVPAVLAAADVFVLSSTFEGNPLSIMEAMAAGRPVVATNVGCIPELVSEATGIVVPAGDERALQDAMYALGSDIALAREKGSAAERVARVRFGDEAMARAYERLFRGVV